MQDLPTELWLRIVHFVSEGDLFRLVSVNRLFYSLAIDRRYRQLVLDVDRPSALLNRLVLIENNPLIAGRVQSLCIHPKAIRSACLRSGNKVNGKPVVKPAKHPHWPENFRELAESWIINEDIELADHVLSAVSLLGSVQEMVIEWKQHLTSEERFCLPFLSAIWTSLGKNLTKINLDMALNELCEMVSNVTGLEQVHELILRFICNYGIGNDQGAEQAKVAKFINQLSLSLQYLSITSLGHLDVSHLYSNLIYFPRLNRLTLQLPCDPRHAVNAQAIRSFLSAHSDVTRLHFSPQYCCYQSSQPPWPLSDGKMITTGEWLERCFSGIVLPQLQNLELGLNILGSGGKRVLPAMQRIGYIANNLNCLSIIGCLISLDDLDLILCVFMVRALKRLIVEVHVMNRVLLDTISARLPFLEQLDLTYRWVDTPGCINQKSFIQDMEGRFYADWSLQKLQLRCSRQNDDARWPCQKAISRCIPSLEPNYL